MRRPVAYLRRSAAPSARQARDGHAGRVSYEVQHAAVLELANRNGDTEPEEIVEWGRSGAAAVSAFGGTGRGGKRRASTVLREQVANGEISTIYAYSLSRLARSTRELLDLAATCADAKTAIKLAKEGDLDFTTPHGRLYLTVLAAVATFEAEVSRERAMDRVALAREAGRYLGEPPLGWKLGPEGKLVHDDDRTPVEAALAAFAATGTYRAAALRLNEASVPTHRTLTARRYGQEPDQPVRWNATVVSQLIRRELGTPVAPSRRGSRTHQQEPLARLLFCAECGGILTPERRDYRTRKGTAGHYRGWRCHTSSAGRGTHGRSSISERNLLPNLRAEAERLAPPTNRWITHQASAELVHELDERRARLLDALDAGTFRRDEIEPRIAAIEAERTRLASSLVTLTMPTTIDWNWPADRLGPVLTAIWKRVEVDLSTGEITADWHTPEWRQSAKRNGPK